MSSDNPSGGAITSVADERIKGAHHLDGDSAKLTDYYDGWAANYDEDSRVEKYQGPRVLGDLGALCQTAYLSMPRPDVRVLDAGCGTGQVGVEFVRRGFSKLDGADLSEQMVDQARLTGAYAELFANVDLGGDSPVPPRPVDRYDIVVSCGLFLHGHLPPEGLRSLLGNVRDGGVFLTSTRNSYLGSTTFLDVVAELVGAGRVEELFRLEGASYIAEEDATYWVLRVL